MSEQSADLRSAPSDRIVRGTLLFLLGVPLLVLMYLGSFSRFLADDYCTNATLVGRGFLGSQAYWYLSWSGRYSFTSLKHNTHSRVTSSNFVEPQSQPGIGWGIRKNCSRLCCVNSPTPKGSTILVPAGTFACKKSI